MPITVDYCQREFSTSLYVSAWFQVEALAAPLLSYLSKDVYIADRSAI